MDYCYIEITQHFLYTYMVPIPQYHHLPLCSDEIFGSESVLQMKVGVYMSMLVIISACFRMHTRNLRAHWIHLIYSRPTTCSSSEVLPTAKSNLAYLFQFLRNDGRFSTVLWFSINIELKIITIFSHSCFFFAARFFVGFLHFVIGWFFIRPIGVYWSATEKLAPSFLLCATHIVF